MFLRRALVRGSPFYLAAESKDAIGGSSDRGRHSARPLGAVWLRDDGGQNSLRGMLVQGALFGYAFGHDQQTEHGDRR